MTCYRTFFASANTINRFAITSCVGNVRYRRTLSMVATTGQTPKTIERSGSCACGNVQYKLHNDPMIVHACHCADCQRHSGAPFVVNAWTEENNFELLQGQLETSKLKSSGSNESFKICFCPTCSTALYSKYQAPKCVFVRVHTLDDPSTLSPDVHIWTRSKPDWLDLSFVPNDVPIFEEYYKMREVWKPENVDRFKSLMPKHRVRK